MVISNEIKRARKVAKQAAAAAENAKRAEAFMAELNGEKNVGAASADIIVPTTTPKKKKRKKDAVAAEDAAHAELETALAEGDAAARKKAKKLKREKAAAADDGDGGATAAPTSKSKKQKKSKSSSAYADADASPADAGDRPSPDAIAAFRAEHAIKVAAGTPDPIVTFQRAPFPKKLIAALLKQGYASPTPIQAQAWPIAVTGRDVIAVAKTGSGKTCAFLLPALSRIMKTGASAAPDMEMVDGRFRRVH